MSLYVDIRKKLGHFQLEASFEHKSGVLGLLGASGSGKSITLQCIAGIVTPDEGHIELDGRVLFDSKERINLEPQKRNVGYLFQNYALFPNMTVEKNILCGMYLEKDRAVKKKRLCEAAEMMKLTDQLKKYPDQLSGGQQQRTALARIIVSEPDLLLLDEPFSALDSYLRDKLQIQIKELLGSFHKDVVLVSHSRDDVYRLCQSISLIDGGRILKTGKTKSVFADPGSRAGAVLTGCKNIAKAEKRDDHTVYVPEWGITLATDSVVRDDIKGVGIRAHYFNTNTTLNRYNVIYSNEMEEAFETTVMFRYEGQSVDSEDIWWRMSKEKRPAKMPEALGIAPKNVLLLYE